jgi:hypothetical protein
MISSHAPRGKGSEPEDETAVNGIVQWSNEINGIAVRDDDTDDRPDAVVRLRTRNRRWALQALGRSVNEVPCWA